jgi:hypothetical protein
VITDGFAPQSPVSGATASIQGGCYGEVSEDRSRSTSASRASFLGMALSRIHAQSDLLPGSARPERSSASSHPDASNRERHLRSARVNSLSKRTPDIPSSLRTSARDFPATCLRTNTLRSWGVNALMLLIRSSRASSALRTRDGFRTGRGCRRRASTSLRYFHIPAGKPEHASLSELLNSSQRTIQRL